MAKITRKITSSSTTALVAAGVAMIASSSLSLASSSVSAAATAAAAASVALPRMGLGMAALGRPGYINLDRSSVFDGAASTNDGQSDSYGDDGHGDDLTTKMTTTTVATAKITKQQRSIEMMQSQSDKVLDTLIDLASTGASPTSSSSTTTARNQMLSMPWIDCARSYGLSEKFVGQYLRTRNIQPSQVYVSSKWGYTYVADWKVSLQPGQPHEIKDHSVTNFLKQLHETDVEIGEYVKLYQIHSATFDSGVMDDVDVHRALVKCRMDRGWKIGLSVSSPYQHDVIRKAIGLEVVDVSTSSTTSNGIVDDDDTDQEGQQQQQQMKNTVKVFDSVQCTYNVLEQRPQLALQEAYDAGLDIIIKEGLANGRVLRHPVILDYAQRLGCEADQLALACILAQPFRPSVLSGAVTPEQLESNLKAIDVAERLLRNQNGLLHEIMSKTIMDSEEYWKERSNLAWN